ncbi:MAG: anion permease [Spirochaetes bacterium]|nr:anion permease [Spirochaetota bacterium]
MFRLISGVYLGWGLGANDAANIFGTGVASGVIKYRTAVILTAIFVLVGAYLEGSRGMETYGKLTDVDINSAFIASLAAAITINILTMFALPVSTSQAIVGSIIAVGLMGGGISSKILTKVLLSWVLTPIGAAVISYTLYRVFGWLLEGRIKSVRVWSLMMKVGFFCAGIYGAYTLGANNVANSTGVFVKAGMITPTAAVIIGGLSIGLGVLTFSRRVMMTIGRKITEMSDFAALIAVLGQDITVHIFTWVGVPVSTSQAIVGAVMGVGLVKSSKAVNLKVIGNIGIGWISTPAASFVITLALLMLYSVLF